MFELPAAFGYRTTRKPNDSIVGIKFYSILVASFLLIMCGVSNIEKRVLLGLVFVVLLGVARALFLGGVWADEAGEAGGADIFSLIALALGTVSAGIFVLRQPSTD